MIMLSKSINININIKKIKNYIKAVILYITSINLHSIGLIRIKLVSNF